MGNIAMFVSYLRRDDLWVKEGEFGLIPWLAKSLARKNVEIWYDTALKELPGEDFKRKIKSEIDRAEFAILLISQEFLNSDFVRQFEMPCIKERVDRNEMTVIPILVDHTVWEVEDELRWITDRQMLPGPPTPLIEYTQNMPRWRQVRSEILQAILHRIQPSPKPVVVEVATSKGSAPEEKAPEAGTDNRAAQIGATEVQAQPQMIVKSPQQRLAIRELGVLKSGGLSGTVRGLAITPDGRRAVSGGSDGTLTVWNLETRTELHSLKGHGNAIMALASMPAGRGVVSAGYDGTLGVWDAESLAQLCTLVDRRKTKSDWRMFYSVAVAPNGQVAVSGSIDGMIKAWDIEGGMELPTLGCHGDMVWGLAITPDGRSVVSAGGDKTLKVWDAQTGVPSRTGDGTFEEWELTTTLKTEKRTLTGHHEAVLAVALTPDGQWVVSGSRDGAVKVWDLIRATELRTLMCHSGEVNAVAVMPGGRQGVSASSDGWLKLLDLEIGRVIATFNTKMVLHSCAVGPDGMTILAGDGEGCIHVLRLEHV